MNGPALSKRLWGAMCVYSTVFHLLRLQVTYLAFSQVRILVAALRRLRRYILRKVRPPLPAKFRQPILRQPQLLNVPDYLNPVKNLQSAAQGDVSLARAGLVPKLGRGKS